MRYDALRPREARMVEPGPNALIAEGADWRLVNELKRALKA
jgi:hypothetical protein